VQTGKGSVKVERSEPTGNLDGFLARLHSFPQNEGMMDQEGYVIADNTGPVTVRGAERRPKRVARERVAAQYMTNGVAFCLS
jgi:hypothetical protein